MLEREHILRTCLHKKLLKRRALILVKTSSKNGGGRLSKARVLIGDNSCEFGMIFSRYLNRNGFDSLCRRNDLELLKSEILSIKPEAVVLCILTADNIYSEFIEDILNLLPETNIIAVLYIASEKLYRSITAAGAKYCILMPSSMSSICKAVDEAVESGKFDVINAEIASFLIEYGFPNHIKGFGYLCTAIELSIQCPELIYDLTDGLYPKIAEIHNTTASLVERSLRHVALLISENGADKRIVCRGHDLPDFSESHLTNSEMICAAVDAFIEKYKKLS